MNIITQLIPKNATGRRPGISLDPEYITLHSTGNVNSSAKNEADNVCNNHPNEQASFHYVVGEVDVYQTIPDNEVAWHAGDGFDGEGNRRSLSIEMIETGNREKVLRNAMDLAVYLAKLHNIPADHIVLHNKWSHKDCPRILRNRVYIKGNMNWDWFQTELNKLWKLSAGQLSQSLDWAEQKGLYTGKSKADLVTYGALLEILYKLHQGGK